MTEESIPAEAVADTEEKNVSSPVPESDPVQAVKFGQFAPSVRSAERSPLDLILDVGLDATVELGRSQMMIRDILQLGPGSVIELDRLAGEPVDLLVNGKKLARGEVVVIHDNFGLRITEILPPTERINSLR